MKSTHFILLFLYLCDEKNELKKTEREKKTRPNIESGCWLSFVGCCCTNIDIFKTAFLFTSFFVVVSLIWKLLENMKKDLLSKYTFIDHFPLHSCVACEWKLRRICRIYVNCFIIIIIDDKNRMNSDDRYRQPPTSHNHLPSR